MRLTAGSTSIEVSSRASGAAIRSAVAALAGLCIAGCGGLPPDADPLASMARTVAEDERFPRPLSESWRRTPEQPLTLDPAVGASNVYLAIDDRLVAWSADDGATAWGPVVLESPISAAPLAIGSHIVVATRGGDQAEPRVVWFDQDGNPVSQTVVDSPITELSGDSATLVYVDGSGVGKLGGDAGWHTAIEDAASVRLAAAEGLAIATTGAGSLIALDVRDGSIRWRSDLDAPVTPAHVSGGRAFIGTTAGELIAFQLATGREGWRLNMGASIVGAPAQAEDLLWVAGLDARLSAVKAGNGTRMHAVDLSSRNYLDLTSFGQWAVVGARYGPWVAVRAPTRVERSLASPLRPPPPVQVPVETPPGVDSPDITVGAASGPAGVAVVNGDGTVVFLEPQRTR